MYRFNTAGQFVCFQMLLTATGAVATGLSPAVRRCIDGTFAAGGGTVTEDAGTGSYKYAMTQADTNGSDISFIFSAATAIPICVNIVTTQGNPQDGVHFGLSSLPNAAANAVGGLPILDANSLIDVDCKRINAVALAAQALANSASALCWGTCSGGTTVTAVVSTLNNPSSLTDATQLNGRTIIFLGNTGTANVQSQASNITNSTTGATPTITFTAMTHAPANGDTFVIV